MTINPLKRQTSITDTSNEKKQKLNELEFEEFEEFKEIDPIKNFEEISEVEVISEDNDDSNNITELDNINVKLNHHKKNNETKWQKTVEKVVKSVVSIHFMQPVNFDTEVSLCSEATGFVVDSVNGIILTNRHVVGPGPFIGYAVFDNHEEVEVKPVYRDPVHDFGFLKFDPSLIKYMSVSELTLRPELAKIGSEIRVIGNDSGEKLSILSGFISRLDRNAPDYGANTYNDFNTEYIQAAASASGGSSGSPVVNIDGYAVALQAGGSTESSTDFFLPVWRVLRSLKCLQENSEITRGTIQVQWVLEPFDKCRRLGLHSDIEKLIRNKNKDKNINGMLVNSITLPGGPAYNLIKEGDCLVSINDKLITSFIEVDEILDQNVDKSIKVIVQRDGKNVEINIKVDNLHDITPNKFVEVCGATFNDLSYQLARIYGIPVRGVYVSNAVGSFQLGNNSELVNCWIIDSVDNKLTPNLESFIDVMKGCPDKSFIQVKYHHLTDIHVPLFKNIFIDRHWSKSFKLATRNDFTGLWDYKTLQKNPVEPLELTCKTGKFLDLPIEYKSCKKLNSNFVQVDAIYSLPLDSFSGHVRRVHGFIIDATNGYILISRHVIAHDLCDINITIAESIIIPGKVIFLHPTKGYAIIKYDPKLINAPIKTPKFSDIPLEIGDKVLFIGYNKSLRAAIDETKVSDIGVMNIPTNSNAPTYKATNVEALLIDSTIGMKCGSGILCDYDGTIRGFWISCDGEEDKLYTTGINITDIMWELEFLKNGKTPDLKIIDVEFSSISLATARINGVSEEYIEKIQEKSVDKFQFLYVPTVSIDLDNKPSCDLKPGDIILTVEGRLITRFRDIDEVIKVLPNEKEFIKFKIVREKKIIEIDVKLTRTGDFLTNQVVFWAGCSLQEPHHGVRQVINNLPSRVYCTTMSSGSPSRFYAIGITNFITHVNEEPTPTLNDFLRVVKKIKDNTYCKLRIVSFDDIPVAQTLKVNYHYFPTAEVKKIDGEWKVIEDEDDKKAEKVEEVDN